MIIDFNLLKMLNLAKELNILNSLLTEKTNELIKIIENQETEKVA